MASPSTVISRGYGSWGTVNELPTIGYGIGAAPAGIEAAEICFTMRQIATLETSMARVTQLDVTLYQTTRLDVTLERPEC